MNGVALKLGKLVFHKSLISCIHPARSDRYSHEFVSDEEEGDDEAFQQPFENFSSTAPRFSDLLELSFEEKEPTSPQKKIAMEIKHEKRDSGIGGIDDTVKILEGPKQKPRLLSADEAEAIGDATATPRGEEVGEEEEEEEEEENVITRIDEVRGESSEVLWRTT